MAEENIMAFQDDEYVVLQDEFTQIRQCIGMYISYKGSRGAFHLFKEIFNNALDECVNKGSPADTITVLFDEKTNEFIIHDNGRGIPFDQIIAVTTKKHSSTKFDRSKNKYSCGQNGVGLKVTAALSSYFSLTSYRGDTSKTIEFINGEMVEGKPKKCKDNITGTVVRFIPNPVYLEECDVEIDSILDWMRRVSYIIPDNVLMNFTGYKKGSEAAITRKYTPTNIGEAVKFISSDLDFEPVVLESISDSDDDIDLVAAFSYDRNLRETIMESYCNYAYTVDGGVHENATRRAISDFFIKKYKDLEVSAKYDLISDDILNGLIAVVNCRHPSPSLGGQTKEKLDNNDVASIGRKGLMAELEKFFSDKNALLRKFLHFFKTNAQIRLESVRIKNVDAKKTSTYLDDYEIPKFVNVADRKAKGYRELILTEGDSALSACRGARNVHHQAIFTLNGVITNSFNMTVTQAMNSETLKNLVKILGCGIGPDFEISKLRWDKIIILTDQDVDGSNITSLLCAFFIKHMPDIIKEGRLYKSLTPLYKLDSGRGKNKLSTGFVFDKKEFIDIYFDIICRNTDISLHMPEGSIVMDNKSKLGFLYTNKDYLTELSRLVKRASASPTILEHLCWILSQINDDVNGNLKYFQEEMSKVCPELEYTPATKALIGSYEGTFVSIIIDALFSKMSRPFREIQSKNATIEVSVRNKNDKEDKFSRMTIGEFLDFMDTKYAIDIESRYKGLGELDPELVFETTINPKIRKIIRLDMDNYDSVLDTFTLLHDKKYAKERQLLLENTHITEDDIDN